MGFLVTIILFLFMHKSSISTQKATAPQVKFAAKRSCLIINSSSYFVEIGGGVCLFWIYLYRNANIIYYFGVLMLTFLALLLLLVRKR